MYIYIYLYTHTIYIVFGTVYNSSFQIFQRLLIVDSSDLKNLVIFMGFTIGILG